MGVCDGDSERAGLEGGVEDGEDAFGGGEDAEEKACCAREVKRCEEGGGGAGEVEAGLVVGHG